MKNKSIISMVAATALAISPFITSTMSVNAAVADTASTSTTQADTIDFTAKFTMNDKAESINPNGMYFQVSPNSSFNPTNFKLSDGSTVDISAGSEKITVDSNTVDTSKAGSIGTVKLTAGSTTITYTVLVTPEGLQSLNLTPQDWVYGAPYVGSQPIFRQGEKYYIGSLTKIIDGEMYTSISKASLAQANKSTNGYWIPTKYLANTNPAPTLLKKTVMHKALAYSYGGGSKYRYYNAYRTIYVDSEPVSFNGGQYYQVFNADGTYTSDYLKVGNIDGTERTLKHNAYVYATSTKRANKVTLKKGTKITTYGSSYTFKNGKRYYRIEGATKTKKMYVKVANFE